MKNKIIIGGDNEQTEVRFKEYALGTTVSEFGDVENIILGKKPINERKLSISKEEKKELFEKPDSFGFSKGRLVRKEEKK